jgi:hypothetical protein
VSRGRNGPELGVLPVRLRAAAAGDPVFGDLAEAEPALTRTWQPVATRFAAVVRERAMAGA